MVQVRAVPTPPWCRKSYSRSLVAACPLRETYPRLKPWASLSRPARGNSFVNSPRSAGDTGRRVGYGGRWPDLVEYQPSLPARKINQTPRGSYEESISTRRRGGSDGPHRAIEAILAAGVGKDERRTNGGALQYNHGHGFGQVRRQAYSAGQNRRTTRPSHPEGRKSDAAQ